MKIIKCMNLEKSYKKSLILSIPHLSVEKGKMYLIVGENGSGKSTLLKMIMKLYFPTKGLLQTEQGNPIGYAPEKIYLPNHLRVYDILVDLALLRKMEERCAKKRIMFLLEEWSLDPYKKIGALSKGMFQKLIIIQSIMHYPKWYFFDEPLNGFDNQSQKKFILLIKKLKLHKKTIFITSHYPKYFQKDADYLWYIRNGTVDERTR